MLQSIFFQPQLICIFKWTWHSLFAFGIILFINIRLVFFMLGPRAVSPPPLWAKTLCWNVWSSFLSLRFQLPFLFEASVSEGRPAFSHRAALTLSDTFLVAAGRAHVSSIYTFYIGQLSIYCSSVAAAFIDMNHLEDVCIYGRIIPASVLRSVSGLYGEAFISVMPFQTSV